MFFPIFYTITKEKNKSPKILIIFPFFWTKYSFSSKFTDLWNFLYHKIFQVKDWGLKTKRWDILKGTENAQNKG